MTEPEQVRFSVLLSVYYKDNAAFLLLALDSIITQSVKPGQVVIVEDGELSDELRQVIYNFKTAHPQLIDVVRLEKNSGISTALNEGLKACKYDFVARMDADDIAVPERFEKQLVFFSQNKEYALLGGQLEEFSVTPGDMKRYRKMPLSYERIKKFSATQCPFNHPTVMYRKSVIEAVGGYEFFSVGMEDYHLWLKVIKGGYKVANLNEVLILYRRGNGMINRRRGVKYFFSELDFVKNCRKQRLISHKHYLKHLFLRLPLRLLPTKVLEIIYNLFLRSGKPL